MKGVGCRVSGVGCWLGLGPSCLISLQALVFLLLAVLSVALQDLSVSVRVSLCVCVCVCVFVSVCQCE